jgi:hypothetical protein
MINRVHSLPLRVRHLKRPLRTGAFFLATAFLYLHSIQGIIGNPRQNTAKAPGRKGPEALPVGSNGQLRESKRRARPSQALIVRSVPGSVNGTRRRRLN